MESAVPSPDYFRIERILFLPQENTVILVSLSAYNKSETLTRATFYKTVPGVNRMEYLKAVTLATGAGFPRIACAEVVRRGESGELMFRSEVEHIGSRERKCIDFLTIAENNPLENELFQETERWNLVSEIPIHYGNHRLRLENGVVNIYNLTTDQRVSSLPFKDVSTAIWVPKSQEP